MHSYSISDVAGRLKNGCRSAATPLMPSLASAIWIRNDSLIGAIDYGHKKSPKEVEH